MGENTYVQIKNDYLIKIILVDENGEEILGVECSVEAIEEFDLKTGWLLATTMMLMKNGSSLIKVLKLTDALMMVYKSTKAGSYLENKQNLVVNGILTNQKQPKTLGKFQLGKQANFEGSNLINQQKERIQELVMRHLQVFSQIPNDLGYCDKIKHQIQLNKSAQPCRRNYCCWSSDKEKQTVEVREDAMPKEPAHLCWAAPSILVKK